MSGMLPYITHTAKPSSIDKEAQKQSYSPERYFTVQPISSNFPFSRAGVRAALTTHPYFIEGRPGQSLASEANLSILFTLSSRPGQSLASEEDL